MTGIGHTGEMALELELIAELAAAVRPEQPPSDRIEALRARILGRVRAPAPDGTSTIRFREGDWIRIAPLIEVKVLRQNRRRNFQTALWRLQPGAVLPTHHHAVDEECLVLSGEIHVGDHYVRTGDYHVAHAGHDHPNIESAEGALLLIRGELWDFAHA